MKYSSIELDEKGRAKKCPKCENEIIHDGDFCQICGTDIVNRGSKKEGVYDEQDEFHEACGKTLYGESRFCHICGLFTGLQKRNAGKNTRSG